MTGMNLGQTAVSKLWIALAGRAFCTRLNRTPRLYGLRTTFNPPTPNLFGAPKRLDVRWMSDPSRDPGLRKKRVLFKAKSTGMKELDVILGEFIRANPEVLDDALDEFESFLELETCFIYDSVMGKVDSQDPMVLKIRSFVTSRAQR